MGYRLGLTAFLLYSQLTFAAPPPKAASAAESAVLPTATQAEWSRLLLLIEQEVRKLKLQLASAGVQFDSADFDRLFGKIGPQSKLKDRPLIMVLLGMHNSGKSTFTNLVIRAEGDKRVTTVSDVGGSTTVPVALLPQGLPEKDIALLFPSFKTAKLNKADDATKPVAEGETRMLWIKHPLVPPSVAVVDAPDVDSWKRGNAVQAMAMIDVADVVAVMVTDQYANHDLIDALKEVASAGKSVMLIFNKADMKYDIGKWPKRVKELIKLTGVRVIGAYTVENRGDLAEAGALLPFFRIGEDGSLAAQVSEPLNELNDLQLEKLRIQSEWGALEHALNAKDSGLEVFLQNIEATNTALTNLTTLFADTEAKPPEQLEWPKMPSQALGTAVLESWGKHHRGTTTTAIRALPYVFKWGLAQVWKLRYQAQMDALEKDYRQREFAFMRDKLVDLVLRELQGLLKSGKLKGRLADILEEKTDARNVSKMQADLQAAHEHTRLVDADMEKAIKGALDKFKQEQPTYYSILQNGDTVIAAAELLAPVTFGFAGSYGISSALMQNLTTSLVAGPVGTAAGWGVGSASAPLTAAYSDVFRNRILQTFLTDVVSQYGESRIRWLMKWLKDNYLQDFYEELSKTAAATGSQEVSVLQNAISCARMLGTSLTSLGFGGDTKKP